MTTDERRAQFETLIRSIINAAVDGKTCVPEYNAVLAAFDAAHGTAAKAMREAAAKLADHAMADHIADAIRALPIPALEVL